MDRYEGKIVDFEIGDGTVGTFQKLYERIKKKYNVKLFCSDKNPVYKKVLEKENHILSKSETCFVESLNSSLRDMVSKLNRKTKRYAKSMQSIYNSVFIHVHRNFIISP